MWMVLTSLALAGAALALAPPASSDSPTVADLDWMVGRWQGTGLGGDIEEIFLPARGGAMPATFRLVRGERVVFYEFILVEQTEAGVEMRLHHFNPGMTRWEEEPVVFDLAEVREGEAIFTKRDDEAEESRLTYRRTGDELKVELSELRAGERAVTARFSFHLTQEMTGGPDSSPE
jgi:hypothetical protein